MVSKPFCAYTAFSLRTLEFWVDNLNPLYLYPECSKQKELFTCLMQALSRHLRPAPYPYGLLTLRLLGKLGGKNRLFLREPMHICEPKGLCDTSKLSIECFWKESEREGKTSQEDNGASPPFPLRLPLNRCVDILKMIALAPSKKRDREDGSMEVDSSFYGADSSRLWECNIEDLNLESYYEEATRTTKRDQAVACLGVIRTASASVFDSREPISSESDEGKRLGRVAPDCIVADVKRICTGLLYCCMIDATKEEAGDMLKKLIPLVDNAVLCPTLALFLSEASSLAIDVGLNLIDFLLDLKKDQADDDIFDVLVSSLCEMCCSSSWGRQDGLQRAMCKLIAALGSDWGRKHEVKLINASLLPVKTVPREVSSSAMREIRAFVRLCSALYGLQWTQIDSEDGLVWDMLSPHEMIERREDLKMDPPDEKEPSSEAAVSESCPSEEVFRIIIYELASPQQLVRFAARFLLTHFIVAPKKEKSSDPLVSDNLVLIRRVLFSRSLRLLPLPQQVGVVEGLTSIIKQFPGILPLSDQHLLSCLSEVLKLASVADGEMDDEKLEKVVVDKDGYAKSDMNYPKHLQYPTHASSLFFRRECVVECFDVKLVVPEELPAGVQLRVSAIMLFHTVVRKYTDEFFDAAATASIGKFSGHLSSQCCTNCSKLFC